MPKCADARAAHGLSVRGLACERGGKLLFGPRDLDVGLGTALFVLGPNGSGKTTLLRALAGLSEAHCASARWSGVSAALRSAEWRARVCYAGHRPGHKDELNAIENLALACELDGRETNAHERRQALARVDLAQRGELPVKRLSQGQRQRLALARLLLSTRPLWLLDEPTAALDANARGLLAEILNGHLAGGGVAVVATHDGIDLPGCPTAALEIG